MIKAEELRIGNLILSSNNVSCRVESIDSIQIGIQTSINKGNINAYDVHGTPINEDFLLRFRFQKDGAFNFSFNGHGMWQDGTNNQWYFVWHFQNSKFYKAIQFVHQLQNLYFVLTEEELKVTE